MGAQRHKRGIVLRFGLIDQCYPQARGAVVDAGYIAGPTQRIQKTPSLIALRVMPARGSWRCSCCPIVGLVVKPDVTVLPTGCFQVQPQDELVKNHEVEPRENQAYTDLGKDHAGMVREH